MSPFKFPINHTTQKNLYYIDEEITLEFSLILKRFKKKKKK